MTSPPPPEVDFGQVWRQGDDPDPALAVVLEVFNLVNPEQVTAKMGEIIRGRTTEVRFTADVVDGVPQFGGPWRFHAQLPWIRCVSDTAAGQLVAFLREKGMREIFVSGDRVSLSLTPPSVIRMAEDASERGWVTDREAGAAIGRLP